MGIKEGQALLLVPHMVSRCPYIDRKVVHLFENRPRYPETAGGIFNVDGNEIDLLPVHKTFQFVPQCSTACVAEHITHEQQSNQRAYSTALVSRITVTLIWPGYVNSASTFFARSRAIQPAFSSEIC